MIFLMKFALQALELSVKLGITSEERAEPQMVLLDLDYEYDVSKAIESDDISDTLDYQQIYDAIKSFVGEKEWDLIEKLHVDMKKTLIESFSAMENVKLTLTKFPFEDGAVVVSG